MRYAQNFAVPSLSRSPSGHERRDQDREPVPSFWYPADSRARPAGARSLVTDRQGLQRLEKLDSTNWSRMPYTQGARGKNISPQVNHTVLGPLSVNRLVARKNTAVAHGSLTQSLSQGRVRPPLQKWRSVACRRRIHRPYQRRLRISSSF